MRKKDIVLELQGITISFGNKTIIDSLSLDLYKGEIVSLLGENGSGKSTLMKIIVGLVLPDQGENNC